MSVYVGGWIVVVSTWWVNWLAYKLCNSRYFECTAIYTAIKPVCNLLLLWQYVYVYTGLRVGSLE